MSEMTVVKALELAKEIAKGALAFWKKEYAEDTSDGEAGDLLRDEDIEEQQTDYLQQQVERINHQLEIEKINLQPANLEAHEMRTRDEIMSDIKATGQVGNALVLEVLLDIRDQLSSRRRAIPAGRRF